MGGAAQERRATDLHARHSLTSTGRRNELRITRKAVEDN